MKNIISILLIIFSFSCKAQQEYPLNTNSNEIPVNSYIKDYNHELDTYVGTWKANYNGNQTTLFITKEIKKLFDFDTNHKFFSDVLTVKYEIKNSSAIILQSTLNNMTLRNNIFSMSNDSSINEVGLYYSGTNCGVGWGRIYIKKLNNTQISWAYYPNDTMLTAATCPGNPDLTIYLPETENLVFTKQ
ncbi:DUF6705 family protein [Halpernia sp.]|uniref:DUF6705 family protein n=1 Tax=Halpernia sp. TaxID=2782209 RepID=UPI003A8F8CED